VPLRGHVRPSSSRARQGCHKGRFWGKLPSGRHPDIRARPRLPRGCGFTRGQVFTVRRRGKNRVRGDAGVRLRGHERVRAEAAQRPRGREKKKLKIKKFGSCCRLGKRDIFFNFQFSIFGF
jgi:hypothetical protein